MHDHGIPVLIGSPDGPKWELAKFHHDHTIPADVSDHWHPIYLGGAHNAVTDLALRELLEEAKETIDASPMPGMRGTPRRTRKL